MKRDRSRLSYLCLLTLCAPLARAGELDLEVLAVHSGPRSVEVELEVAWKNAWRSERNHDAVWIVVRHGRAHLGLAQEGHRAWSPAEAEGSGAPIPLQVRPSRDGVGAWLVPGLPHRGDVRQRVLLALADPTARPALEQLRVHGVEMVHVPAGAYELGDEHPEARALGSFFAVGEDGAASGPYRVEDESALPLGTDPGQLHYEPGEVPQYRGDARGPIPAAFPKGVRGFYVMKYELRQGAYADFLNALPRELRGERVHFRGELEERESCSLGLVGGRWIAAAPSRPANFLSWEDSLAWLDWMGLRPMTELEFEKAARGPSRPLTLDFPWGTDSREPLERLVQPLRDLAFASAEDELTLTDATRSQHGASYYWVMDLSGSLWERVVSAGHPRGRAFEGSHGDGVLDGARATNADWPRESEDGRAAPGIGYRGGAQYFGPEADLTNPESRVAIRTFAAWEGAYAYKTYSARGVRTAE